MLVYILLLSAMLSLWFFLRPKRAFQVSMLATYVLCSLRYDFGNYIHYKWIFVTVQRLGLKEIIASCYSWGDVVSKNNAAHAELGYAFLNWLFSGVPFEWFVAATTGFLFLTIYFLIVRYGEENFYWFAFLLFVNPTILFIHLSAFRQSLAACLLIWAVVAHLEIKNTFKRRVIELLLIVAMTLIHKSAILLLALFPLADRLTLRKMFVIYCLLWAVMPLLEPLLLNASTELGFYDAYTSTEKITSGGSLLLSMVLTAIFFCIVFFDDSITDPPRRLCTILYCFVFMTRPFNSRQSLYLFNRYDMYFNLFAVIALPLTIKQMTNFGTKLLWKCTLISFFILRAYLFFLEPRAIGQYVFLYTSIFEKGIVLEQNWIKGYDFDD